MSIVRRFFRWWFSGVPDDRVTEIVVDGAVVKIPRIDGVVMLAMLALVALTTMAVPDTVDPYTMVVIWTDGSIEEIAATNFYACDKAMNALASGRWVPVGHTDRPAKAICMPGNSFAPNWNCIKNFNCPK